MKISWLKRLIPKFILAVTIVAMLATTLLTAMPVYADAVDLFWIGGTGNFSDPAHWATVYTTGTATFVNGSTTVEGGGGCNWTGLTGQIRVASTGTWYTIASITDADTLELTAVFAQANTGAVAYVIATAGHAAPTATNNVYFNIGSFTGAGQVVTVDAAASCLSMDWTGATNVPTLVMTQAIQASGNVTFLAPAAMTMSGAAQLYFVSAGAQSLTTNGLVLTCPIYHSTGAGTLTFMDSVTSGDISLETGGINTNGQIVNSGAFFISTAAATTLTMGASVINLQTWQYLGSNLTIAANTATINCSVTGAVALGDADYNGASFNLNGTSHTVSGSPTDIATFTRNGTATNANSVTFTSGATLTCTDFSLIGNSRANQLLAQSSTLGTAATITVTNAPTLTNVDLMDLTFTNAADYSAQDDIGDCGGNTNITFPAAVVQTSAGTQSWGTAAGWSGRVPLPQDDVTCSHSKTIDIPRIGKSVTFSGAITITISNDISIYGSYILASEMTYTNANSINLRGRGSYTINPAGKGITSNDIFIMCPSGEYTLLGDVGTLRSVFPNYGTFNTNGYSMTMRFMYIYYSGVAVGTRALNLSSSTITMVNYQTAPEWNASVTTGLTFNAGTSTIIITTGTNAITKTFAGGGLTYNNVTVQGAGAYTLTITGSNTFNTFTVDRSVAAKTIVVTPATTQTFSGFVSQTGGTRLLTLNTGGATANFTMSGTAQAIMDYVDVTDIESTNANDFFYGANGAVHGTTTNWAAGDYYRYWVSGTGNWSDPTNHWSLASGGAGGVGNIPDATKHARFDENSFGGAGLVCTVDAAAACLDMDWTGVANTPTLVFSAGIRSSGSVIFIAAMTTTGAFDFEMAGAGKTLTTNGLSLSCGLSVVACGSITLADDYTSTFTYLTLNSGTLDTNGKTVTCRDFYGSGTNARTLTLGTSVINCTQWTFTTVTNLTVTANTSTINVTGTGAFAGGNIVTYNDINLNGTSHTVSGAFTCVDLTRTGTATKTDSVTFTSGTTVTCTTFAPIGNSATNRVLVQSSKLGTPATITATNWTGATNVDIMDITATNAVNLSAIAGKSGDCGGNTNITFTTGSDFDFTHDANGNWSDSTKWTDGLNFRVPLPQDNANVSGTSVVTVDMPRIGEDVTFTGTPVVSAAGLSDMSVYGSFTLVSGMTFTPSNYTYYRGRGAHTVTCAGQTFNATTTYAVGGTYTQQDAYVWADNWSFYHQYGTWNTNNYAMTGGIYNSSYGTTRGLVLGSSTITLNTTAAGTKWNIAAGGLTFDAGTSTIVFTNSGVAAQTFGGGGLTYNNVTVQGLGAYALTITGDNTYNIFRVNANQSAKAITATGTTQTVNDFTRNSGTSTITITNGTWTKSDATPIALDYLNVTGSTANAINVWYAGSHSGDGGGNVQWLFTDPALTTTTQAVTGVALDKDGVTTATLNGTVTTDLDGTPIIGTLFNYGLTALYGSSTASVTMYDNGVFTTSAPTTLTPNATYHVRGVSTNGNVASPFNGGDVTVSFTMPSVTTGSASQSGFTATLAGNITAMGVATSTYAGFEWGYDLAYGHTATLQTALAIGNYTATISGYNPTLTIYYRSYVTNGAVTVYGGGGSFIPEGTLPATSNVTNLFPLLFGVAGIFIVLRKMAQEGATLQSIIVILIIIAITVAAVGSIQSGVNGIWGG